ncbi:Swc4p [Sporobolomyces koalae]|uniref:Swc4p n=1 Tax=Sporobolomyces koalae TaxID=500713 RepID=UPI003174D6D8
MTSKDVRDIMQLGPAPTASSGLSVPPTKRSGPPGPPVKRPDGITRELYALIGDNAPSLAMAQPVKPKFKERIKSKKDQKKQHSGARWRAIGFTNPSRGAGKPDSELDPVQRARTKLVLRHWVKDVPATYVEGTPDSKFTKFNTTSQPFSYTDREYDEWLRLEGWTKQETDHLFDLAVQYDLRFVVMADRWEMTPERGIDALKDRYYSICRTLAEKRPDPQVADPGEQEKLDKQRQETVASFAFDLDRELERKAYLRSLLDRTPAQIAEEDFLYVESRRIEQNYHKIAAERADLLSLLGGRDAVGINLNSGIQIGSNGTTVKGTAAAGPSTFNKKKMTGWEIEGNGNGLPEGWAGEGSKRKATAAQDAANCIERHPAPSVSAPKSNMWPSVALRSSRIQPVKSGVAQKVSIALSELGLSTQLIMPTKNNIAKLDEVQVALSQMVEVKKAVDRIQQEIRTARKKKEILLGIGSNRATPMQEEVASPMIKLEDDDRQRNKRSASVASSTVSTKRARRE